MQWSHNTRIRHCSKNAGTSQRRSHRAVFNKVHTDFVGQSAAHYAGFVESRGEVVIELHLGKELVGQRADVEGFV